MKLQQRAQSVQRLGRSIFRAYEKGDPAQGATLIEEMIAIARDTNHSESSVAFRWLADNDGGLLDDAIRRELWLNPALVVDIVKAMRRFSKSPAVSAAAKHEALQLLERHGLDDESLRTEREAGDA